MSFSSTPNFKHGFPTPGPQSPTGNAVMDHVFFLSQSDWKNARENENYDLIIIGSGCCAHAVAQRALDNDPHCRILILERGPFFLPEHFQNLPLPFMNTLGGLSETFPWSLSDKTANGKNGSIRWQHGMIPFFGGRSTLWSAWCPRPNEKEMDGWPSKTIHNAQKYFDSAEALLRVERTDMVDHGKSYHELRALSKQRPVYGQLQHKIQDLLLNAHKKVTSIYRTEAAPIACDGTNVDDIDFQKYSSPGPLIELAVNQQNLARDKKGARLDIVSDCRVDKIINQGKKATALQTSRGILPINNAKLILSMGTLPPTTLVRNSFPDLKNIGERFSAHFISAITARIPIEDFNFSDDISLEMGAYYIGGIANQNYKQQFHVQLTSIINKDPIKNAGKALRYMPDVISTASMAQLETSKKYVIFVCSVLGELDFRNDKNWFRHNAQDTDLSTNSILQVVENKTDHETWDVMDASTFKMLEEVLSPQGKNKVEYWHGTPDDGQWLSKRPCINDYRVDALVHESSTLFIGEENNAPVDTDYLLKGTDNVFITGGALWPQGGSWNPTMTMVALSQHLADNLVPK